MFRKEICGGDISPHFPQLDRAITDLLLNPKALGLDMPKLSKTLALAYAYRSAGVSPDSDRNRITQVVQEGLLAERHSCRTDHFIKFGLTR